VRFDNGAHSNLINNWKSQTTPALGSSVTFSADGRFMAGVSRQPILTRAIQPKTNALPVVWDISTGKQVPMQANQPNGMILGFTPDSKGLIVSPVDDDQNSNPSNRGKTSKSETSANLGSKLSPRRRSNRPQLASPLVPTATGWRRQTPCR
jgi:hypothetical protein